MGEAGGRRFDLTLTGELCLDFVNTVDWRTSARPKELLDSYADLVRWAEHTGVLTEPEGRRILREAARRPAEASAMLDEAKALRETLTRIFSMMAAQHPPDKADLEALNNKLKEALARLRVGHASGEFRWEWDEGKNRLDVMLWPTVRAAAEFLVNGQALAQLRECANQGCGWLFVDTSRNKSRRWCSMGVCGNRAKARRHYEQVKAQK